MNLRPLRILLAAGATALLAATAHAQIIADTFNFDSLPDGATASLFNTAQISFHQAQYVPLTDSFGDPITGTDHWEIDLTNDSLFPVTAENPLDYARGNAPSGTRALQALWQPVLLSFNTTYDLQSFSFNLDNDTFGSLSSVAFVTATGTVAQVQLDQTIAGYHFSASGIAGITGIVLPSGAFYDDISLRAIAATQPPSAVPEPSTYGMLAGALTLAGVVYRRQKRRSA